MIPLPALLLQACASVTGQYELARSAALSDPGLAPDGFLPDAQLLISGPLLDELVGSVVQGLPLATELNLGLVAVSPALVVTRFAIRPEEGTRFTVELRLEGDVTATSLLGTSSAPVVVDARVGTAVVVSPAGEGYVLEARPEEVEHLSVEVPGFVSQGVSAWVRQTLVEHFPPIVLAELGHESLPLRGVRVAPSDGGVRVDLRTAAPDASPLTRLALPPETGFRVRIATDSLVKLARARAFLEPPVAHGVVVDPVSLELRADPRWSYDGAPEDAPPGMPFTLGLVLWRPVGRGWWRSYDVDGRLQLTDGRLALEADQVREVDHSPGAVLADPLVALAEGTITRAIGRALTLDLETAATEGYGDLQATVALRRLTAGDGALEADGSVEVGHR